MKDFAEFKKQIETSFPDISNERNNRNANPITTSYITKFSAEEVRSAMETGNVSQLREISEYYCFSSGFYNKILIYYSTMLLYLSLVTPVLKDGKKVKEKKIMESYIRAVNFVDALNLKKNCCEILYEIFKNGAYYGLVLNDDNENFDFKILPYEYCRANKHYQNGIRALEFDLSFFDKISSDKDRKIMLEIFPREIKKSYNLYKEKGSNYKWALIPPEYGVAFLIDDEQRPPLFSLIPQIINVEEYRGLEKAKDAQEIHKLLVQKMPLNKDGDLIFSIEEAGEIHKATARMLKNNPFINVLTTFADVDVPSLKDTRSVVQDNIEKVEKSLYSEAGVSKEIFSPDGNLSMGISIKNDLSYVMSIVHQIEEWVQFLINKNFSDKNFYFNFSFLPISYYNQEDYTDMYLGMAQSGYSKILPILASGISQNQILNLIDLENNYMSIVDKLIPLQTSFTQSGDGSEEGGAPTKESEDKAQQTIKNEKTIDNNGDKANGEN